MLYNSTQVIGQIIESATLNVTGSLYLTLLGVILGLVLICLLFRIPIEFTAIIVLPLMLGLMAYMSEFRIIGGVTLIYLGVLLGKNFFFK
jgi:hypothetical protein